MIKTALILLLFTSSFYQNNDLHERTGLKIDMSQFMRGDSKAMFKNLVVNNDSIKNVEQSNGIITIPKAFFHSDSVNLSFSFSGKHYEIYYISLVDSMAPGCEMHNLDLYRDKHMNNKVYARLSGCSSTQSAYSVSVYNDLNKKFLVNESSTVIAASHKRKH